MARAGFLEYKSDSLTADDYLKQIIEYDPHLSFVSNSVYVENELEKTIYDHFIELRDKWIEDTQFDSSFLVQINHPAYLEIIAMGDDIVPILLEDMKLNRNHWFHALSEITNENPILPEHAGNIEDMINDWINWGDSENLI